MGEAVPSGRQRHLQINCFASLFGCFQPALGKPSRGSTPAHKVGQSVAVTLAYPGEPGPICAGGMKIKAFDGEGPPPSDLLLIGEGESRPLHNSATARHFSA